MHKVGIENEIQGHTVNGIEAAITRTAEAIATIKIGTKLARAMKAKYGMKFFFRRLDILEVHATRYINRAQRHNHYGRRYGDIEIEVSYRFHGDLSKDCNICGKRLDLEISKATGIGPVCANYLDIERKNLDDAKEVLNMLHQVVARFGTKRDTFIIRLFKGEEGLSLRELQNKGFELERARRDAERQAKLAEEKDYQDRMAKEAAKQAAQNPPSVEPEPDNSAPIQGLQPNQIRVASWKAEQDGHPAVLTVTEVLINRDRWFLLQTKEVGKVGVPKSLIEEGSFGVQNAPQAPNANQSSPSLSRNQIRLKSWFAKKENLPKVLTIVRLVMERPKAVLYETKERGKQWVPKSAVLARRSA